LDVKDSPEQLRIQFDATNPLAACLQEGKFTVLVEVDVPAKDQPFDSAITLARQVARQAGRHEIVSGIAVTDRLRSDETHDNVEAASNLQKASGLPAVLHVSGRMTTRARLAELTGRALSEGVRNVLLVSGDAPRTGPGRADGPRAAWRSIHYLDSVKMIAHLRAIRPDLRLGAGVNPFKYNPADVYLQYFKMIRKLAGGAEFIVAHAGWDMAKLQELQWYLQMREINSPVLARLAVLSPDEVRRIHDGVYPGVFVSRELAAQMQRESSLNANQFMAAQLRRIGLQVAGCALLGFSGVQIAGLRDEATARMVLARVEAAPSEYPDYPTWLTAWKEYHDGVTFAPAPDAFYAFSGLLTPDARMFDPEAGRQQQGPFPDARLPDRWRAAFWGRIFAGELPDSVKDRLVRLLGRGRFSRSELEACRYLYPGKCPKGLVYGACGGAGADGICEFRTQRCFFHRVLAVAAYRRELDCLEREVADAL